MADVIVTKNCPKCDGEPLIRQLVVGFNLYCPRCDNISVSGWSVDSCVVKWNKLKVK